MLAFKIIMGTLFVVLGVLILIGKGDWLIAGYNIASAQEREKYDLKRLRLVMGIYMLVLAVLFCTLLSEDSTRANIGFAVIVLVLAFVAVFLANAWARKKGN